MDQLEGVLLVGLLFGAGLWCFLEGRVLKAVIGLVLLSNAVNYFLLLTSGDPRDGRAPIVGGPNAVGPGEIVDPLPQALILTAIVIGFGVLAFLVALLARAVHDEAHDAKKEPTP